MISIIISKIPLHVYLLIRLGRDVNSEMHLFYQLLCTLQYGRPQQPLHTINPHPIHTPWNICPMVNVIPHVVGQTVLVSFYSVYTVPKKPLENVTTVPGLYTSSMPRVGMAMIQSVYSPTFTIISYQLAWDWGSWWRGVHWFTINEILVNTVGQRDKAWFMPRSFVEDQSSNKLIPHIPSSYSCGCMIDNAPDIMEVSCTISCNHWKPAAVLRSAEMEAFSC